MQITHRALADAATLLDAAAPANAAELALPTFDKAPRLSCCCRLSELLPKVRQLHDAARTARLAAEGAPSVAA
ncbi:hypothetical protein FNT36_21205 [Hymenobacter setariae]|uniref:Uncharacterized protein n=1 Tax=Hymenobacter setariae TaxID=2594794 RepID=A0A558BMF3_9BACT|nr:hypothetical protein [Hymenobacter setariae]TVT37695.1 hypothetical protein FNT36_21205 [Hymenobacter setariae]